MEETLNKNKDFTNKQTSSSRARKLIKVWSAVLSAIMLILLLIILTLPKDKYLQNSADSLNKLSVASDLLFQLDEQTGENLYPFTDEHLLMISNDLISYVSLHGKTEKVIPIQVNNYTIKKNNNYALIADYNGFNYYLIDEKGIVTEGKTTSPILASAVSNDGHIAFILDEPKSKGLVRLLDSSGKHIMDYYMREKIKSGYPLNLCFSNDNSNLYIDIINLDGGSIKTHIHTIELNKLQIKFNLNVADLSAFPEIAAPSADTKLVCLYNDKRLLFTDLNESYTNLTFSNIRDISFSPDSVSIIAKVKEEDNYSYFSLQYKDLFTGEKNLAANMHGPVPIGTNPYNIKSDMNLTSVASDDGIYIISPNSNEALFYAIKDTKIIRQEFITPRQIMLICSDGVRVINI